MANQITDNRTLITNANAVTGFVDLTGAAAGAQDTEIFYAGTASVGQYTTSSIDGLLYNYGSTQNLSNNTFYFLINCGIVGLLDTKANGGMRIRFTGATVTNWFEVYVAGSDNWPPSFAGGWTLFVVDIETARSTAVTNGWTNGTTPATSAIQRVGYAAITGGTMPRMVDNTWMDALYRLPDGSPAIIVEGRNGGSTDWDWSDVIAQSAAVDSPVARNGDGGAVTLSGPVQFGINDTTTHGFSDTNKVILWDNQEFLPDDVYSLSALGNSGGTTNVALGIRSGSGTDATGAQGCVISAASTGARWSMDFDDPNLDSIGLYGCSFIHGATFQLDDAAVEVVSSLYIDCEQAIVSNSSQVRNTIVNAATADGTAFMVTDDMGDIARCSFEFSDGHAIELNAATPTSQTNLGNLFAGYTNSVNSTDAALLNSAGGALTINSSGGSNIQTNSYRNTGGGSVSILNNVSVTFTNMKDNSEVRVYNSSTGAEVAGIENATTGTTDNRSFTWSAAAALSVDYVIHNWNGSEPFYQTIRVPSFTVPSNDTSIQVNQLIDRNAS